jgi:hypothetical protein
VFDSATKIPVGVLAGNQYQLGHYDECVEISVNTGERFGGTLRGQYCLAEIHFNYSFSPQTDPYILNYDPRISAWEKLTVRTNQRPTVAIGTSSGHVYSKKIYFPSYLLNYN